MNAKFTTPAPPEPMKRVLTICLVLFSIPAMLAGFLFGSISAAMRFGIDCAEEEFEALIRKGAWK